MLIILLVVLAIGLPTVLVGVAYYMGGGGGNSSNVRPSVYLYASYYGSSSATILVSSIQPATEPANLRLNLVVNWSYGTPATLPSTPGTAIPIVVGPAVYEVYWSNVGGSGLLTPGDSFYISFPYGAGVPSPGTTIQFLLLWQDGSTLATASFTIPDLAPAVELTVTKTSAGADVLVANVSATNPPTAYLVNIENVSAGFYGNATGMPLSSGFTVTVTVGLGVTPSTFTITWSNPSGNGVLSPGDHFLIAHASGAYATGTTFAFVLEWHDYSTIASISWQV